MKRKAAHIAPYLELLKEATLETLWPTRCALCDLPGKVLCPRCERLLPYVDSLQTCGNCGAPFGRLVCTECNHYALGARGLNEIPLDGCRSACRATDDALQLITTYKDRGEQALANPLARIMAASMPIVWNDAFLVPIPARADALRKRGFDHTGLLAANIARTSRMHRMSLLRHLGGHDQRELGARRRLANMQNAFEVVGADGIGSPNGQSRPAGNIGRNRTKHSIEQGNYASQHGSNERSSLPRKVVLVDDVMTTGATLYAAAETLKLAGVEQVYGLTFARA